MDRNEASPEDTVDSGVTLVELLVYSALLLVVLVALSSLFIATATAQKNVEAVTESSNAAQVASRSIAAGIRSSSNYLLTTPTPGTQLLTARVAVGTGASIVWMCQGWYYSASEKTIRYSTSNTALAAPTTTWLLLASGIKPGSTGAVFAADSSKVSIDFVATAGSNPPASIKSAISSRAKTGANGKCF
jgi:hypothetical protein